MPRGILVDGTPTRNVFASTSILFAEERGRRYGKKTGERRERKKKGSVEREGRLRNNAKTQESIQRKARIMFP